MPLEIYIDADACPVRKEVLRVAERHLLTVHLVSNRGFRPSQSPLIHNVMVPATPDAADDWIAEQIGAEDICVTGDIPLAARCLEKGARVLDSKGKMFTEDSIGMALAMRDLMSHLRETGEVGGGGPGFTQADRSRFLQALETAVQAAGR
ncbi:YaiI/YqxD family protein [Magnetospira thiophila]